MDCPSAGVPASHHTTLAQDLEERTTKFQQYVIKLHPQYEYPLSRIGKADQTPLTFDVPRSVTILAEGSTNVSVMMTRHEKDCFMVMLG